MEEDIRWKQRFFNYEKAFFQLKRFLDKPQLNEFEEQGLIKCFEYNYELAWNLMKDYLVFQGIIGVTGSRDAIRQSYNKEIIEDGETWMQMINDRILTVHTYDETTANLIESKIITIYYPLFEAFYIKMKKMI